MEPMYALQGIVNAVISDPPYGVRAGGRKVKAQENVTIRPGKPHFPSTEPYTLGETLRDLLNTAAQLLRVGGRLVYFMPSIPDIYEVRS